MNVLAARAVMARRHADHALEVARQVALIGKARLRGDVRYRPAFAQQGSGSQEPKLRLAGVRRHAELLGEQPAEMKGAQGGDSGEMIKRDVIGVMLGKVIVSAAHRHSVEELAIATPAMIGPN